MKKLLFFIIIISYTNTFAQNYKLVNTSDDVFYKAVNPFVIENYYGPHSIKFIISVKTDSILINFNQTIYYPHKTIVKYDSINCFNVSENHWLGEKIIEDSIGNNILFNNNGDSIFIKTLTNLNTPWVFYKYSDNSIIEAEIISITNDQIFNLNDSVKTIQLTHKDSVGYVIPDIVNNVTINLSKNYGFTQFFSFRDFPDSIQIFEITGIQSLNEGNYIPTLAEIYGFNPGDELHYSYYSIYGSGNINNAMPFQDIRIILTKSIYNDSLTYSYDLTRYRFGNIFLQDTVFVTVHNIDSFPNYIEGVSGKSPMQTIFITNDNVGQYSFNSEDYNYHETLIFPEMYIQRDFNDTNCFNYFIPRKNLKFLYSELNQHTTYIKGLGILRSYLKDFSNEMPDYACNPCEGLLYYNVNGQQWGSPLEVNSLNIADFEVTLYPNPAINEVNVTSTSTISEITIFNTLGKKTLSFYNLKSNTYNINIKELLQGIYFVKIKESKGTSIIKKLIIK